jgi:hypothetical protein
LKHRLGLVLHSASYSPSLGVVIRVSQLSDVSG